MATTDNLVKVGQLQTVLTRVKSELDSNAPVVKIYHGGNSYSLADNLSVGDSTLTVDSSFEFALDSIFGTEG